MAPKNMSVKSATRVIFHRLTSWLKTMAEENMSDMLVTLPVSKARG